MNEPAGVSPPMQNVSPPGRNLLQGAGGFLVAIVLAVSVATASFRLVFVPGVPYGGRVGLMTLALGIGLVQAIYLVPIHIFARRGGAEWFCSGIRQGALWVLLANIGIFIVSAFWPHAND